MDGAKHPAQYFAFFLTIAFASYAFWHIGIGRSLGDFLPSTPGELPKNDPVRSLYDAFQGSFMLGFLAVFLITMFNNACFLFLKRTYPKSPLKDWIIYASNGVIGLIVDVVIIIYLEMDHGPWNNVFWRDLKTHWQVVSLTTGTIALAGAFSAFLISYAFFKSDRCADDWRKLNHPGFPGGSII
ncbi:MAG: hypothetical protein ACYDET_09780 [Thermoleophilia bacterium]